MKARCLAIASLLIVAACAVSPPMAATEPMGDEEREIRATVQAVYGVLSGPAGDRDWDRFEQLFTTNARLIAMRDGKPDPMTLSEFIARNRSGLRKASLYEIERSARVDRFRDFAQVFSATELHHERKDRPFSSATHSFQLVRSSQRWLITNVVWQTSD